MCCRWVHQQNKQRPVGVLWLVQRSQRTSPPLVLLHLHACRRPGRSWWPPHLSILQLEPCTQRVVLLHCSHPGSSLQQVFGEIAGAWPHLIGSSRKERTRHPDRAFPDQTTGLQQVSGEVLPVPEPTHRAGRGQGAKHIRSQARACKGRPTVGVPVGRSKVRACSTLEARGRRERTQNHDRTSTAPAPESHAVQCVCAAA